MEVSEIAARWCRHFQRLFEDETGHSPEMGYWDFMDAEPRGPELTGLNAVIQEEEVWEALVQAKNHKAPGPNGIPMDFIKAALAERTRVQSAGDHGLPPPETPMTDSVTKLVNQVFETGAIPTLWENSALIPIP